jgi:DNA mismatch endonuclease, patch repair protein
MQATRRRDTAAEQLLKAELGRLNLEYDEHVSLLPGSRRKVDFVFRQRRLAVFVDGCFWHGCPVHATAPKANGAWWRDKLDANQRRDRDTDERLRDEGWTVLRFWEHEDASSSAETIRSVLSTRETAMLAGGRG